ncbi:MAG: hypothetical protein J5I92_01340 [Thiogranum sp.]|nr:hypothetical protein [Thiogranum sp.]
MKASLLAACLLVTACGEPSKRLDDYLFYDGPVLQLKVVRFYRNIPFNYLGEHAVVMCRSEHTRDFRQDDARDNGWRILGDAGSQGSQDAREAALAVQDSYRVIDAHILVVTQQALNISFDACGSFSSWDPTRLPPGMIEAVEKPDSCAPAGPVDCRYLDFEGERTPRYDKIATAAAGQVSFNVVSTAFRDVQSLRVHTRNNGALWHVDTVTRDSTPAELQPDTLRALRLEVPAHGEQPDLAQWLESVLAPRSMVVWPRHTTDCRDPAAAADASTTLQCAEIRFRDGAGNHGIISLALDSGPNGAPSFHAAVYSTADASYPAKSLTRLRDLLATAATLRR